MTKYCEFDFRKTCKPDILVELLNAGADPNIPNGKFSASALAYAVTNTPGEFKELT